MIGAQKPEAHDLAPVTLDRHRRVALDRIQQFVEEAVRDRLVRVRGEALRDEMVKDVNDRLLMGVGQGFQLVLHGKIADRG